MGGLYKITYHSMSTYYSQHHNISAANSTQKNAQMGVCERTAGGPWVDKKLLIKSNVKLK